MPAFAGIQGEALRAVAQYLFEGKDIAAGEPDTSPINQPFRFTGYRRWLDPEGYPAIAPPWGTLNAIDLATGKYRWRVPFGEFPELEARGARGTGSENYGGPLVTAGGLLFIGASIHDRRFRAFDKRDGKLLWEAALPYLGRRNSHHLPGRWPPIRSHLRQRRQGAHGFRRRRVCRVRPARSLAAQVAEPFTPALRI